MTDPITHPDHPGYLFYTLAQVRRTVPIKIRSLNARWEMNNWPEGCDSVRMGFRRMVKIPAGMEIRKGLSRGKMFLADQKSK